MKIDHTAQILDLSGAPILKDNVPLTLGAVAVEALLGVLQGDQSLTGPDKAKMFKLAMKIGEGANFEIEDIAMIKNRIGIAYGPLVVGRAYELLDPQVPVT